MAENVDNGNNSGPIGFSRNHRDRALWIARHVLPHEADLRLALRCRAPPGFEIDDIVQEIYARLAAMPVVEHIENPKGYIYRMATGLVMDHVRRNKVVPMVSLDDIGTAVGPANEPTPEAHAIGRDELGRLGRILSELPAPVGDVFRLRRLEKLSQKEVSERLGVPESTVEKRMSRAVFLMTQAFKLGGKEPPQSTQSVNRKLSPGAGPKGRSRER